MAALTSGSWTITYRPTDRRRAMALGEYLKLIDLKLVLASGNPPATLKLPGFQSVGLVNRLDKYIIDNPIYAASGSGAGQAGSSVSGAMLIQYGPTGNQLKFFRVLKGILASGTGTAGGTAPLVTTAVINSQTLYVTAVGWAVAGLAFLPSFAVVFFGGLAG